MSDTITDANLIIKGSDSLSTMVSKKNIIITNSTKIQSEMVERSNEIIAETEKKCKDALSEIVRSKDELNMMISMGGMI